MTSLRVLFLALVFVALLLPLAALAEGGDHGTGHGFGHGTGHGVAIPMSVTFQAINFALYAGLLLYFLRKPIREFFKSREQVYKQALIKAENARRDAEKKKKEVQQRLRNLDATADESLDQARAEATALKLQIRQEAETLAERLRNEANRTAQLEVERARATLREEMLKQSVELSRKLLADEIADGDQKRLQTEFVNKIQEVR
jgi:F-type H+-transporting ATPase subunit b